MEHIPYFVTANFGSAESLLDTSDGNKPIAIFNPFQKGL